VTAVDQRQQLIAKKQQLEQLIKNKLEVVSTPMAEWNDELSSYDQHPGDQPLICLNGKRN
jgi:flavorubredoxin